VRKLAERASTSTKEIGGLISGMQRTVNEAVSSMQDGTQEVEQGVAQTNEAGAALEAILISTRAVTQQADQAAAAAAEMGASASALVAAMESVSAVVEENTAATEEMAASSSEVTTAIENIASVSEENSASVEEVSASTEEMSAQVEEVAASAQAMAEMADTLTQVVSMFKLSTSQDIRTQVEVFKKAHLDWVDRLNAMQAGKAHLTEKDVANHKHCALGKWYYSRGKTEFGKLPEFIAIEGPHERMHQLCRQTVLTFNSGDKQAARQMIEQVRSLSKEVVDDLMRLEKAIG
jgi:methyl-accepting chemotaxis protein